ncbi:hypothetical protein BH23BAC4_BH23BAC4_04000 [soil metagenome]
MTFLFKPLALLALVLVVHPACAQSTDEAAAAPADPPGIDAPVWLPMAMATQKAVQSDRPIMIAALAEWCGWCVRLERDTFADAEVRGYLAENFASVKIDVESQSDVLFEGQTIPEAQFASMLGVRGVPATVILGPDGELLTMISGYYPPEQFLLMLRYIREADYDKEDFDDFRERVAGA